MQFPKWLMQDSEFSKLSSDAKILYTVLKDRFKLSYKNKWYDKDGKVYVICKRETMGQLLNKSKNTITSIVNELVKFNLIEEKRNGLSKPNYIYLLMPDLNVEQELSFDEDNYIEENSLTPKNWDSANSNIGNQESQELSTNNNNSSKNNFNSLSLNNNIDNKPTDINAVVVEINKDILSCGLTDEEKILYAAKVQEDEHILDKYKETPLNVAKILGAIAHSRFRCSILDNCLDNYAKDAQELLLKTLSLKRYSKQITKINTLSDAVIRDLYGAACNIFDPERDFMSETYIKKTPEAYFIGVVDNILDQN